MPIAEILAYCSMFSVLIPIFFLLRKKQNFKNSIIKILGALLFVSLVSDLASLILFKLGGKSSTPIVNTFFITQFVLLSCVYYRLLKNKNLSYIAAILFLLFFCIKHCIHSTFYRISKLDPYFRKYHPHVLFHSVFSAIIRFSTYA